MGGKTGGGNAAFHNYETDYAHINDLNERRHLAVVGFDSAPFG